jgi:hypothetical protein
MHSSTALAANHHPLVPTTTLNALLDEDLLWDAAVLQKVHSCTA